MSINNKGYGLIELIVSMAIGLIILIGLYDLLDENQKVYRTQQEINTMTYQVRAAMDDMVRTIRSAGNNRRALRLAPPIYVAEADRIRVLADLPQDYNTDGDTYDITSPGTADDENENGDQQLNDPDEDITFLLDGNQLIRRSFSDDPPVETGDGVSLVGLDPDPDPLPPDESEVMLADNILELTFRYYTAPPGETNANELATPIDPANLNQIQIVRIRIVARTEDRSRQSGRFHTIDLQSEVELRNR
ncbi:MAG TPA: prepilin-type N-terminal cleavage/methylation domain-containing protein [Acidobacteriota bacterium]|nr:prepilin-type N-terminal cleavage/methylation domain-containing protein [Acidobacteriota bacterium]